MICYSCNNAFVAFDYNKLYVIVAIMHLLLRLQQIMICYSCNNAFLALPTTNYDMLLLQ